MELTQERLKRYLNYNPETGIWTWTGLTPKSKAIIGERAGYQRYDGYWLIGIFGRKYRSARLAFFYMKGYWPIEVDHKNRDTSDDRWSNLREATGSQNVSNRNKQSNNTSGATGVCWDLNRHKWLVQVNGIFQGRFDDFDEAVAHRDIIAESVHGEFVSLNSKGT